MIENYTPPGDEAGKRWMEACSELTEECLRHKAEIERLRQTCAIAEYLIAGSKDNPSKESEMDDRMMKWFEYEHLPVRFRVVSAQFCGLAKFILAEIEPGPERTVALRKLLEAKDAAVRATVHPGG